MIGQSLQMGTQVTMTAPQGGFPSLNEEESWQKGQRGGGWRERQLYLVVVALTLVTANLQLGFLEP